MKQNSSTMDIFMSKGSHEVTESAAARLREWRGSNVEQCGSTIIP